MPSGSIIELGESAHGCQLSCDSQLGRAGLHQLEDVADGLVQVGQLEGRLAVLREREHVHDQVVDLGLVLLDDRPAAADDRFVLVVEAQVDQVAAAADALEDVLDVMREGGDRLADGGEPFRLDLVVVEDRVLDRQAGLVADRDHEHQLLLAESAALIRPCRRSVMAAATLAWMSA